MTVFEMYEVNGNRAGFWVQRNSWGRTVARVVSIGGMTHGVLPVAYGRSPHYNRAKEQVYVEIWRATDGRWERVVHPDWPVPGTPELAVLSCPGTYAYCQVRDPRL